MSDGLFLAVDWGTTNRRCYVVAADGSVVETQRDDRGVTALASGDFAAEVASLRQRFGDLPTLLAGMVGSNIGWQVAPYVPAPAGLSNLAAGLLRIDERTAIVPGVSRANEGRADVMRGEEVQLLGAIANGSAPADALLCQPGTHCKWAEMRGGALADFVTAMTGELFALLRRDGLLASQLGHDVAAGPAFDEGLRDGKHRDLAASLFGIRAAGLLGRRDDSDAASYASGLLIGADVAARLSETRYGQVHILADPALGALYQRAIAANGVEPVLIDSHAAFVAGMNSIWRLSLC